MATLVSAHIRTALSGSLVSLLFGAQHLAILIVTLLHRPANTHRIPLADVLLAWAGTLLPLIMRSTPESITSAGLILIISGSLLATAAILSLGRSFGMEPAHRGIQVRWCYRIVRHPIYAAYLLIVGGFLLSYASWWNGCVALVWLGVQITRIRREEALLSRDEHYLRYTQRVRWRLVPGVW
jgi:protein-S-isoprenylcysteine O-methyltransferase Ste14